MPASDTAPSTNSQIARNTLYLYLRMLVLIVITLYTSRVVLDLLGVDDFGIYGLVGSIVVLFSFLSGTVTGATQRFLCMALGKNDTTETQRVFGSSIVTYLLLALVIVALSETVGLWLVAREANLPPGMHDVAVTVYQISVLTAVLNLLRLPYQAAIVAYERMAFFAWSSVLEAALKLLVVLPLFFIDADRLTGYAWLICGVNLALLALYFWYVQTRLPACRTAIDTTRLREILSFTGWSSLSSLANVGSRQGMNWVLNIFYGVAYNAAFGIMNQVTNAVYGFILNFQTAINPPLTKHYAAGSTDAVKSLLYSASRLSFYLLVFLSLPLIFHIDDILAVWLDTVPPSTGPLCVMSLLSLYFNTFGGPVWTIMQATGHIRRYQIFISTITLLTIPAYYLVCRGGAEPFLVLMPTLVANILVVFVGMKMMKPYIGVGVRMYTRRVVIPCVATAVLLALVLWGLESLFDLIGGPHVVNAISSLLVGYVFAAVIIAYLGLSRDERAKVIEMVKSKFTGK